MKRFIFTVCYAAWCAVSGFAQAATYTVGPGQTHTTLEALRSADVLAGGDTITLDFSSDNSLTAPLYTGSGTLTFDGSGASSINPASGVHTQLVNNASTTPFTLNVTGATLNLAISGFNVTGNGGAINSIGNLTLSGTGGPASFTGNTASGGGGAIYVRNTAANSGLFTMSGGSFSFVNNTATTGNGGAVYALKDVNLSGGTSLFSGNRSLTGNGGALYLSTGAGTLAISGGSHTFTSNSAKKDGGALYNNNASGAHIVLGVSGGTGGTLTFSQNSSGNNGGAIAGNIVTVQGGTNTFTGNTTNAVSGGSGGAIYGETTVTISGGTNTFTNNSSGLQSGAVYAGNTLTISGGTNTFTLSLIHI